MCANAQNRFRQVPTFGRFTIRRFHNNVSEMKKLAARDFEDILQVCTHSLNKFLCDTNALVSVSVLSQRFEGLLPEPFNGMLLRLLYKAAEWHALAKLRLHTETTLAFSKRLRRSLATSCDSSVTRLQRVQHCGTSSWSQRT
jgi:hypothetical protein